MSNIKWTQKRLKFVLKCHSEGLALNTVEPVLDGILTVSAIVNVAYRKFGFGSHKTKSGDIVLTSDVSCTRSRAKRSKDGLEDEVLAEDVTVATTTETDDLFKAIEVLKDVKLSDIISAFMVLHKD